MKKELNNGGLIGAKIVKQLGTPKRAKTLFALNKRIEICEKLIRDYEGELTPQDFELINDYKQQVLLQENALTTEAKMMGLKNIKLPPKEMVKQRAELLDQHQARHKDIVNGITPKMNESNAQKNNERIKIEEDLRKFEELFPPLTEEELKQPVILTSNPRLQEAIFTPSWNYIPKIIPPVISINGVGFLTIENIAVIVATRGYGKSSICESILSNLVNKSCDCLGFEIGEGVQRAIFLDMERTEFDVYDSWRRLIRRAEVKEGDETLNEKILFKGLRKARQIDIKLKEIEKIIIEYKPQLVILDTAKSFVPSINDEIKCKEFVSWMEMIAWKYQCAILTTLHPNKQKDKKTEETIGGGWLGRVLEEVCEGVLEVTKDENEIRTITSTKERNTAKQQTAFKFCTEKRMMVSCEKVFKSNGRPKNIPLIEAMETNEIQRMRNVLGCNQHKHSNFIQLIKQYIEEEAPTLNGTHERIRVFVLNLIDLRFIKKTGTQPNTTYEFREDENFGTGKQKKIL
jgi:hypothetical protein